MNPPPFLVPTERLLLQGGDERLVLGDGELNKYGCGALPDAALAAFGSSTATAVSDAGFAAADLLRQKLLFRSSRGLQLLYREESDRIRAEIKALCAVSDLPGLEVVLAASGTDLHLVAAQWAAAGHTRRPFIIMMDAAETGSGVVNALRGRHFSGRSALGHPLVEGAAVDPAFAADVVQLSVRGPDGRARRLGAVHLEIESLVSRAIAGGQRVLLVALDVSKTGLVVPSPTFVAALHRRLGQHLDVLVDACQFRLSNTTLRRYLEAGFLVATTGSKFIGGPSFCGALFVPANVSSRFGARALPQALHAYCARAEWPSGWPSAAALDDATNFGLLMRWEAALTELRALRRVSREQVREFIAAFGAAIRQRLAADARFEPLSTPAIDRGEFGDKDSWDALPTIFGFVLHRVAEDGSCIALTRAQTAALYQLLPLDLTAPEHRAGLEVGADRATVALRCQFGQPVACGSRDGTPVSALRVCLSARLIVEATADHGARADRVIQRALAALDKAAWLVQALHSSNPELHHA